MTERIAPLLLACLLLACGNAAESPREEAIVADTLARPLTDGWQEIHTQDGGVMKGELVDGQRHGPWTSHHANGLVRSRTTYVNGHMEGPTEVFHENGMTYYTGQYKGDKVVGEWRFYDRQGELIRTAVHDTLGNLIEQH